MIISRFDFKRRGLENLLLKVIAGILLGIWLVLVLLGKGGFVHIILINGMTIAVAEAVRMYRVSVKAEEN